MKEYSSLLSWDLFLDSNLNFVDNFQWIRVSGTVHKVKNKYRLGRIWTHDGRLLKCDLTCNGHIVWLIRYSNFEITIILNNITGVFVHLFQSLQRFFHFTDIQSTPEKTLTHFSKKSESNILTKIIESSSYAAYHMLHISKQNIL